MDRMVYHHLDVLFFFLFSLKWKQVKRLIRTLAYLNNNVVQSSNSHCTTVSANTNGIQWVIQYPFMGAFMLFKPQI